ncbi:sugar phosphate isomerase/epimerase [Leptolyngbyaceae cyanobacterium JSC-12]|nr:sugar phosphate isomerase/epimerase [Leptolyngbyaceae cyanobacterium JSC-12]
MKLSISNIAWTDETDAEVLSLLGSENVAAVEVAPTRIWADWEISPEVGDRYRQNLQSQGLLCSSLQAILFKQPDLKVFGTPNQRAALVEHLKRVADLAVALGARPMVFGAPKNRDRGDLDEKSALHQAIEVFAEIGDYCAQKGVCLCLEPNPVDYGCNFITNSQEGAQLVRLVSSPGFRLHLDAAGMHLAGEDIPQAIEAAADVLAHFHISEPNLGNFAEPEVNHRAIAHALKTIGWSNWVTIEMRATEQPIEGVKQALKTVRSIYEVV